MEWTMQQIVVTQSSYYRYDIKKCKNKFIFIPHSDHRSIL